METIIVKVDTPDRAAALLKYFKTLIGVKAVAQEKSTPLSRADWVRPGRPATDEEIERMLDECEKSATLTTEEAKERTMKKITAWKKRVMR